MKILKNISTLKKIYFKLVPYLFSNRLNALAIYYGTDKWNYHWYTQHYQKYFLPFRNKKIKLLEIGVGGYSNNAIGGESLRMWDKFFKSGKIYGLDIIDKTNFSSGKIKILQGDQSDQSLLKKISAEYGPFDIIIDDGSHINDHVITTFKILFPLMKEGGIYVVEDTQTSYWENFKGDRKNLNNPETMMNYFKSLLDEINYREYLDADQVPSYFAQNIKSIHFYPNLIFIFKGKNEYN